VPLSTGRKSLRGVSSALLHVPFVIGWEWLRSDNVPGPFDKISSLHNSWSIAVDRTPWIEMLQECNTHQHCAAVPSPFERVDAGYPSQAVKLLAG
jgi:hypothetical protein